MVLLSCVRVHVCGWTFVLPGGALLFVKPFGCGTILLCMDAHLYITQSPIRAAVQGAYEAVTAASHKLRLMENGENCVLMRTLNLPSALDLLLHKKFSRNFLCIN